jgi:hypothetical protein
MRNVRLVLTNREAYSFSAMLEQVEEDRSSVEQLKKKGGEVSDNTDTLDAGLRKQRRDFGSLMRRGDLTFAERVRGLM